MTANDIAVATTLLTELRPEDKASRQSADVELIPPTGAQFGSGGLQIPQTPEEYAEAMVHSAPAQQRAAWSAQYVQIRQLTGEITELKSELKNTRADLAESQSAFHNIDKAFARLEERHAGGAPTAFGSFALNTLGSFLISFAGLSTDRNTMRASAFLLGAIAVGAAVVMAMRGRGKKE